MRTWLTLLLTTALLVHVSVGCCAHHAHAQEACEHAGHESEHDHGHTHHEEDATPPGHDEDTAVDCGQASCVYLPGDEATLLDDAVTFLAFMPDGQATPLLDSPAEGESLRPASSTTAAVRPHLLYQVLLI